MLESNDEQINVKIVCNATVFFIDQHKNCWILKNDDKYQTVYQYRSTLSINQKICCIESLQPIVFLYIFTFE